VSTPHDGLQWRKAAASTAQGACVELAGTADGVAIRDSKDPRGPVLSFTRVELAAFLDGAKAGEFDDLAGGRS
jgi:hypothetical protein